MICEKCKQEKPIIIIHFPDGDMERCKECTIFGFKRMFQLLHPVAKLTDVIIIGAKCSSCGGSNLVGFKEIKAIQCLNCAQFENAEFSAEGILKKQGGFK